MTTMNRRRTNSTSSEKDLLTTIPMIYKVFSSTMITRTKPYAKRQNPLNILSMINNTRQKNKSPRNNNRGITTTLRLTDSTKRLNSNSLKSMSPKDRETKTFTPVNWSQKINKSLLLTIRTNKTSTSRNWRRKQQS